MGEQIVLVIEEQETSRHDYDDDDALVSWEASCRICHESEFESCKPLEVPCSCSGTLKFAHRDCIQRWCDEKGNTVCELCLQKYEAGYTAIPKKSQQTSIMVTIRESVEIPRRENDEEEEEEGSQESDETTQFDPTPTASRCRSLAFTLTFLLLLKISFESVAEGTHNYPFSFPIIFMLRGTGVVLPMYVLFSVVSAMRKAMLHQFQDTCEEDDDSDDSSCCEEDEERPFLV